MLRLLLYPFLFIFLLSSMGELEAATFESSSARTPMIELYTSEGCSSCPPAERWLGEFSQHPRLWKDFIPVALHVGYWDYIGWKDKFARRAFTARQRAYGRLWGSSSIYTPGIVFEGREWRSWYSQQGVPRGSGANVGKLKLEAGLGHDYFITFAPLGNRKGPFKAHLVLLGFNVETQVGAGENRGRKLVHDFIALDYASGELEQQGNSLEVILKLTPPEDTTVLRYGIAAWITDGANPTPVQAVGGYLYGS